MLSDTDPAKTEHSVFHKQNPAPKAVPCRGAHLVTYIFTTHVRPFTDEADVHMSISAHALGERFQNHP